MRPGPKAFTLRKPATHCHVCTTLSFKHKRVQLSTQELQKLPCTAYFVVLSLCTSSNQVSCVAAFLDHCSR